MQKSSKTKRNVNSIEWSPLVNIYWAVQRFTGILLIIAVAGIVCYLGYCVSFVSVPTETPDLLPTWTNMGIVEEVLTSMDICDSCLESGSAASSITISNFDSLDTATTTSHPTKLPTIKTTPSPTVSITTSNPTDRPTTNPTDLKVDPTNAPFNTNEITQPPTIEPTMHTTDNYNYYFEPTHVPTHVVTKTPSKTPIEPTQQSYNSTSANNADTTETSINVPLPLNSSSPTIMPTESPTERIIELSIDSSVKITLAFGAKSASNYDSDCDGDISPDASITYDSNFDIYDTGTQRKGMWLCELLENIDDTIMYRVTDQYPCLWREFYNYAYLGKNSSNGVLVSSWPVTDASEMSAALESWILDGPGSSYTGMFGIDTDTYEITWMKQYAYTQINTNWGAWELHEYYSKWEEFIDAFNANNTPFYNSSEIDKFEGFEFSTWWVYMDVELAFLNGFYKSVGYTLLLCTATIFIFTLNFAIVLLVCVYIVMIVICVVGMYGALGWDFGVIEVIAVPTVVGLSIDYALHVTHSYVHSIYSDRVTRAKASVENIGGSVFASAMTTISSMMTMYFAVVCIFSELGWIVATTASCGIFIAIFICPPLLTYVGPENDQCSLKWCMRKCYVKFCKRCCSPNIQTRIETKLQTATNKTGLKRKNGHVASGNGVELTTHGNLARAQSNSKLSRYQPLDGSRTGLARNSDDTIAGMHAEQVTDVQGDTSVLR